MSVMHQGLPVAVIGAGPVGLAAAAHLLSRGLTPVVFERGPAVGHALRHWAHVRVFSPWRFNIDKAARSLLAGSGWREPDADTLPTGGEIVTDYLEPLAAHPAIASALRLGAQVTAIARDGFDKVTTAERETAPFLIRWRNENGEESRTLARAVIDASGTWFSPNPMGIDGLPVPGEHEADGRLAYGIPDVLSRDRDAYAGARVLVVGGGHSAINVALDLLTLRREAPGGRIHWALRSASPTKLFGGGASDQLPARGALGLAAKRAIEDGRLELLAPFRAERIEPKGNALHVSARVNGDARAIDVDRIVVATGFRPDLSLMREIRLGLDPVLDAPTALAPMIDPNLHSCGTVRPHGATELAHPEPGFYIAGAKSYGRAPTFLMATGYEQVRSIAAELAGDHEAARRVELELPETGVCITDTAPSDAASACCGGPAPAESSACCAEDAHAKAQGASGCGCRGAA